MARVMARLISILGGPAVRSVVIGVGVCALLARRRWWDAALLGVTVGGASLANTLIKEVVRRRRPAHARGGGYSFPSGHTTGSLALLGAGTYFAWRFTGERVTALAAAIAGAPLAGLVGLSRVLLREHHVGDVAAGYALGILWMLGTFKAFGALSKRRKRRH